jgi:hypothetical protein
LAAAVLAALALVGAWLVAAPHGTATGTTTSTTAPTGSAACTGATPPTTYDHVVWIWFENKAPVVGSSSAPYFSSLAGQCGLATNYHGITHPSLPNYLAATGGSTFGVTDDDPPAVHPIGEASIFSQVTAAGGQWRAYDESMPGSCALDSAGTYAVRHNPAAYYTGLRTDCARWDLPMGTTSSGAFLRDLADGTFGTFTFVTPDLCNDTHDCSVSTGDSWLASWMPRIVGSAAYRAGRTAVVVTFDEDDDRSGNLVSTIVVAPAVRAGTTSSVAFDHYSLLRTTEEMLGLPTTVGAAGEASSMRSAFHL